MSPAFIGYWFLLFAVSCVGIFRYKHLSLPFKILTWSAVAIFLASIVNRILIIKYRTNAPGLQLLCIEEYIFYSLVYYHLFKNRIVKKFIAVSIILMVIFFVINAIFLQPFAHKFPTNINIPAQVLNAAFALLLFKEMFNYPVKINILKQGIFWFNTAMLFYATTMFFLLGLSNYFSERKDDLILMDFWFLIDYLFHIMIGIALLTNNKQDNAANT
jgi:hypothetical protein